MTTKARQDATAAMTLAALEAFFAGYVEMFGESGREAKAAADAGDWAAVAGYAVRLEAFDAQCLALCRKYAPRKVGETFTEDHLSNLLGALTDTHDDAICRLDDRWDRAELLAAAMDTIADQRDALEDTISALEARRAAAQS